MDRLQIRKRKSESIIDETPVISAFNIKSTWDILMDYVPSGVVMCYFIEILQVRWNQFSKEVCISAGILFYIPYLLNPWAVPYPLDFPLWILINAAASPLEISFFQVVIS